MDNNWQLQFDYNYADDELHDWVENRIKPMSDRARRGILFFNNHVSAQAPRNARLLGSLVAKGGTARYKAET